METLGKLFGSPVRLKLLRLFVFNQERAYTIKEIARRIRSKPDVVRREVAKLKNIAFVKKRIVYLPPTKKGRKKQKVTGWMFNPHFPYTHDLYTFLANTAPLADRDVLKKLRGVGGLKLVVISGVFTNDFDSRVDLLIVGDRLRQRNLEKAIQTIEAELGKELRCSVLTVHDFRYRLSVYDRLIRDVLEYPHRTILDRVGVAQLEQEAPPVLERG